MRHQNIQREQPTQ